MCRGSEIPSRACKCVGRFASSTPAAGGTRRATASMGAWRVTRARYGYGASTLAGNLTITGSMANIIVVESAKPETKIGFWDYFRVGLPITVMTLLVGWAWLEWVK